MSRSDLVTRTGLTRSAIRGLIGELVAGDLAIESPAALDGTPGRPSPVVRPIRRARSCSRFEIAVDSLAAAAVGLGGTVPRHSSDRPSARALERRRRSPTTSPGWPHESARDCRRRQHRRGGGRPSSASSAGATGWCRCRRTSAGATSRSASVLPRRSDLPVPIAFANESDLAALAEHRRGAAIGRRRRRPRVGLGRRRWRAHRRWRAADRCRRATAARSATSRSTRTACHAAAGRPDAGRPRSARSALLRRAGYGRRKAVTKPMRRGPRRCRGRRPIALAAFAETGRWLGIGLAGAHQRPQPATRRCSAACWPRATRSSARPSRPSSTAASCAASRRLVRVVPDVPRR